MNQDEKIRINIQIDDRDVQNLNDILTDLNRTLQNMKDLLQPNENAFGGISDAMSSAATSASLMTFASGKLLESFKPMEGAISVTTIAAGGFKLALAGIGFAAAIWGIQQFAGWLIDTANNADTTRNRIRRLNDVLDENRQAHENAITEINNNERASGFLINTLLRLNNRTDDLNSDRNEAIRIARVLNNAENDLNLTYDRQTGRLTGNSVATLEQERGRIAMNASLERSAQHFEALETALKAEYEANYENRDEIERLRVERERLNRELEEAIELGLGASQSSMQLSSSLEWNRQEYERLQNTISGFNDDVEYHFNHWLAEQNAFEQERTAFIAEHGLSYEILSDQQRDVVHRMLGYWQMYTDMGSEMFRKLADDNGTALTDIIANQDHNYAATKAWQDNLLLLAARYGEEVAQHFRDMGESGMSLVSEMAIDIIASYGEMETWTEATLEKMAADSGSYATQIIENLERGGELGGRGLSHRLAHGSEDVISIVEDLAQRAPATLQEGFDAADFPGLAASTIDKLASGLLRHGPTLESAYVEAGGNAVEALRREIESGQSQLDESGRNLAIALIQGTQSTLPELVPAGRNLFSELFRGWKTEAEENSPSQVFVRSGENVVKGLTLGIDSLKAQPVTQMQKLVRDMQWKYQNANRDYANIGRDIMSGLNQGLLSGESTVMATANRIAHNIAATMRRALQINSPSRLMREQIGRQIPAGVADGIDKYSGYALDSVSDLGKDLLKVNIPKMSDIISFGPSLSYAGASSFNGSGTTNNDYSNDNRGLFEGANIHWSGAQDIESFMEDVAWATQRRRARIK